MDNELDKKIINGEMHYRRSIQGFNEGFIYKDYDAFVSGDDICYIPEYLGAVFNELYAEWVPRIFGYTRKDLEDICEDAGFNKEYAEMLFEEIDWQHPETRISEWKETFEV